MLIWQYAGLHGGNYTIGSGSDGQGVKNVVYRQSMLLSPGDFVGIFDKLESFFGDITKSGGSLVREGEKMVYQYYPFHKFKSSVRDLTETKRVP